MGLFFETNREEKAISTKNHVATTSETTLKNKSLHGDFDEDQLDFEDDPDALGVLEKPTHDYNKN